MAIIGNFKANAKGYTGTISTLTLKAAVDFEPVERKSNDKAPDFRIFTKDSGFEIGAAWETTSRETGAHYLSVKLDDPSFATPIQCRLIKSGTELGHSLLLYSAMLCIREANDAAKKMNDSLHAAKKMHTASWASVS